MDPLSANLKLGSWNLKLEALSVNRFPSGDELPYKSLPPCPSRFWNWVMSGYRRMLIRRDHGVAEYEFQEIERLKKLVDGGARLLIAPNHADHADGLALYRLAEEVGTLFCHMATHHLFEGSFGLRYFIFPRVGVFPIDREGSALGTLRAARDVLMRIGNPLVVYPEGEVYHTNDRLTPLREGAAAMALTSQKALGGEAPVYIVPVALKYLFLRPEEAARRLAQQVTGMEERFTFAPRPGQSLLRRIHRLASGILSLKELEHLGMRLSGTVPGRIVLLRDTLLERLESRHLGRLGSEPLPERITAVHRRIVERLRGGEMSEDAQAAGRRDLDILFLVLQLFSNTGDYVQEYTTVERIGETVVKLEQDLGGGRYIKPAGERRLTFRIGEPIDMRDHVESKFRDAVPRVTRMLAERLQGGLDDIGPGTHLKELKANH